MKRVLLFLVLSFVVKITYSQEIFVCTSAEELLKLNLETCTYDFVMNTQVKFLDISFDPQGNLFGIEGNGTLSFVDIENGAISTVFNFEGNNFNSLTIDGEGILYAVGSPGILWTYQLNTGQVERLGPTGFAAAGDLTFYDGNLLMAASGNRLIQIDLENVEESFVLYNNDIDASIWGIVSFALDCSNIDFFGLTNGESDVYQIDFETGEFSFVCELDVEATGGASTFEYYASKPIKIVQDSIFEPNCSSNDGWILTDAVGGVGQIQYSLDGINYQNDGFFDNLFAGLYTVFIQDENGCTITLEVDLPNENVPIIDGLDIINPTCDLPSGQLIINASGGTGALEYSLGGVGFQEENTFDNLAEGSYLVIVLDENGCNTELWVELENNGKPSLENLETINTSCNLSNGAVSFEINGGVAPYKISVNGGQFQVANAYDSLSAGGYSLMISDVNGCQDSFLIEIEPSVAPEISILEIQQSTCELANGFVSVAGEGGNGSLRYAINSSEFQENVDFSELESGLYTFSVLDEEGCSDSKIVELAGSPALILKDVINTPASCGENDGSIELSVEGGTGDLEIYIDDEVYLNNLLLEGLQGKEYVIEVIDAFGCSFDVSAFIISEDCPIYIPNIFSPNEDGNNDVFQIIPHPKFDGSFSSFYVYDRWGNAILTKQNPAIEDLIWDGSVAGQDVNPGVYVYVLEYVDISGEMKMRSGDITVLR